MVRRDRGTSYGRLWLVLFAGALAIFPTALASARQGGATPRPTVARAAPPLDDDDLDDYLHRNKDKKLEKLEEKALDGINDERESAGLPPLVCTPELCRIARAYSRDMVERHYFGHSDPEGKMVDSRTTVAGIPWRNVGENIARNRGFKDPAEIAVREWMKSEGHRENILDPKFMETGIGVWVAPDKTVYFTQIFVRRSSQN